MRREIYDEAEFKRALAWVKQNCREGKDYNKKSRSRKKKDWEWEFVVKSAMIVAT
jgi:L-fucose isomerase